MSSRVLIASPLFLLLAGCASSPRTADSAPVPSSTPALESIAGGYALVAIDGRPLPFAPVARGEEADAPVWPVVAGSLTLRSDGVFIVETSYDTTVDGVERSFEFSGTCFSSGSGLQMVWEGGRPTPLDVRADTLMLNNEGTLYSYVRR